MAADHRVAEDVEAPDRARGLEDGAEPGLGASVSGPAGHVGPADDDLASVEAEEAGDAAEQGRLPRPVRADQAGQGARCDADGDVVDRRDGAEGLAGAARFARGAGHSCFRHSVRTVLAVPPQPLVNAVPNNGVGLHEAILPAHMLGSWIPLWFVGEK